LANGVTPPFSEELDQNKTFRGNQKNDSMNLSDFLVEEGPGRQYPGYPYQTISRFIDSIGYHTKNLTRGWI
jgi:hypothetical protein